MQVDPSPEQVQLVDAFARCYEHRATPAHVRASEPAGFDPDLWSALVDMGAVAMAVPEAAGGWGASLEDLALVAEQHGRAVAPAPLIEAQVAARLLARLGPPAADALARMLAGDDAPALVTLALHPARHGRAALVPAAAIAGAAVVPVDGALVLVPLEGARTAVHNLGALPLADVAVPPAPATRVLADAGPGAEAAHAAAVDEHLVLTAAALVGIGARALELGVAYARERIAFGRPIGSFQAIAHPFADSATALDGARLLVREAAWAADADPDRFTELAAMAFAFAYESARDATSRSLHAHGGYGFTLEYDAQLYYRRARAWALVWGDATAAYRRAADARYGPARGRAG